MTVRVGAQIIKVRVGAPIKNMRVGAPITIVRTAEARDVPAILDIVNDAILNTTALYEYMLCALAEQQHWFDISAAEALVARWCKHLSHLPVPTSATQ